MSFGATKLLSASGGKAYEIDQSLIFNAADSTYLSRTPSSAGNLRTWTLSFWTKRTTLGSFQIMYSGANGSSGATDYGIIYFDANDALGFYYNNSTIALTNRKFRDVGAWYHIYIFLDTTASSTGDRWGIYINGVNESSWSEYNHPSQNTDIAFNNNIPMNIGGVATSSSYRYNGYFAEFYNIDGTVKPHTDFGETDSVSGAWIPKKYGGGSFGTTGFYLKFVSGALGTDSSGSSNNWTANNLANADVVLDTPTNNFCTWNPLDNGSTVLSQGNLKFVNSSGNSDTGNTFAIPHTGKWYFEHRLTVVDAYYAGFLSRGYTATAGSYSGFTAYQIKFDGQWYNGSDFESYASSFSNGDILGWAIDCDNGKIYVSVNGTFANSGNPVNGTNPADTFSATADWKFITYGNSGSQFDANFGQNGTFNGLVTAQGNADGGGIGNFYYAPPSGFKAFCSKNLPDPAVKKSTDHFNTVLWTGNGSTQNITGVGFQPDWIWGKNRSDTNSHWVNDAVRGVDKRLDPSSHAAEDDPSTAILTAFGSDGFSLGSNTEGNKSSDNYVAWNWKANGSGGANTDGATNSVVSANTTSGFSIVTYSGTGSATTIGHGLGVVPAWIVVKNRTNNAGNTDAWANYHQANTAAPETDALYWDTTYATTDDAGTWNDTAPTSSVFTVNNWGGVNASGDTYVAYVFAEIEGFSKFSRYTGNANDNGPYVYTGFSPAFLIIKRTDSTSSWSIYDVKRGPINPADELIWVDLVDAEGTSTEYRLDILSNGFKLRDDGSNSQNINGGTFLYMAFAEAPFKYANAR